MTIGGRIKQLREERGWSQEQLGRKMYVGGKYSIYHWESGHVVPDLSQQAQMAELFGVTREFMIRGTEVFPNNEMSYGLYSRSGFL